MSYDALKSLHESINHSKYVHGDQKQSRLININKKDQVLNQNSVQNL